MRLRGRWSVSCYQCSFEHLTHNREDAKETKNRRAWRQHMISRSIGPVVFHTQSRENLINDNLDLDTDDGRELTFSLDPGGGTVRCQNQLGAEQQ
jgi:hypothetical protein